MEETGILENSTLHGLVLPHFEPGPKLRRRRVDGSHGCSERFRRARFGGTIASRAARCELANWSWPDSRFWL